MTNSLDVITSRVQHKSAVVVGMRQCSDSRRAVILGAGGDGNLVELVDCFAVYE